MFKKYKKIVYVAAMLAGLGGMAGGAWGLFIFGVLYFIIGGIFGFYWPREGWRWGIYISLPIIGLIGISILFSGLGGDIKGDLLLMLTLLAGSTAGSFAGSLMAKKFKPVQ
jgi:hypothetical protein